MECEINLQREARGGAGGEAGKRDGKGLETRKRLFHSETSADVLNCGCCLCMKSLMLLLPLWH